MSQRTSFQLLYLVVGFALMAAFTMATLVLIRPLIGHSPSSIVRVLATFSPLMTGLPYGLRVMWLGRRHRLGLGEALKYALLLRPPSP